MNKRETLDVLSLYPSTFFYIHQGDTNHIWFANTEILYESTLFFSCFCNKKLSNFLSSETVQERLSKKECCSECFCGMPGTLSSLLSILSFWNWCFLGHVWGGFVGHQEVCDSDSHCHPWLSLQVWLFVKGLIVSWHAI